MRLNPYSKYLLLQASLLPIIILIFKFIEDRKTAALLAGSLFILICVGTFWWEGRERKFQAKFFWVGGLQFFILFAVPIFLLRLTHWDLPFGEIAVGPIRAADLHMLSNKSYMLWMLTTVFESYRSVLRTKNKKAL